MRIPKLYVYFEENNHQRDDLHYNQTATKSVSLFNAYERSESSPCRDRLKEMGAQGIIIIWGPSRTQQCMKIEKKRVLSFTYIYNSDK